MIRYKLTDQKMQTHNGCQWGIGETKTANGIGELCGPGWLHCYTDLLLAALLNPIHANIKNPLLFSVEVGGKCKTDKGLKEGWTEMTLVEQLEIPEVTLNQRIAFGILCALENYKEPRFVVWAQDWLSGKDRSHNAAANAAYAAKAAANAADAAYAAANAAYAADDAAKAAYIDLIALAKKAMEVT